MQITLKTSEFEKSTEDQVKAGSYGSTEDVVTSALALQINSESALRAGEALDSQRRR
jgi:hypothetical protein